MSLPNYLAKIKSAGIYRFVWDKSVVPPQQAETLRLVVGYSEKGPFNTPVYIETVPDFISIYGNISKKLERKGIFFHRMAIQALSAGPILALNMKPFGDENVKYISFDAKDMTSTITPEELSVKNLYDTNRFWALDADQLPEKVNNAKYITISTTDTKDMSCSLFMRPFVPKGYDVTIREWYASGEHGDMPEYLSTIQDTVLSDYFAEIYVFKGVFTDKICAEGGPFGSYITTYDKNGSASQKWNGFFNVNANGVYINPNFVNTYGEKEDALEALSDSSSSNFIAKYSGILLPYFKDGMGNYISLDVLFNGDYNSHKMLMKMDESTLEDSMSSVEDVNITDYIKVISNSNGKYTVVRTDGNKNKFNYDYCDEMVYNDKISTSCVWFAKLEDQKGTIIYMGVPTAKEKDANKAEEAFKKYSGSAPWYVEKNITAETQMTADYFGTAEVIAPSYTEEIAPIYLEGYTYTTITNEKDLILQNKILEVLNDKGIRTALTNRVDCEYHYIVDSFQSYIEQGCKSKLAQIAKEKDNAFAILNFPPMPSFVKNDKFESNVTGKFDMSLVADKSKGFSLASENTGASWCAYYTGVTFSDGTLKQTVPSAALVSNLFMEKWGPRQPYYIVAGPNYGRVAYDGLVGPDYNYGRTDLDVLEPMGVNAIIYVPRKGTYINSNQTAKQNPVSALSKVHVRELVIYLQNEIESMLQSYQWELNTQALRDTIKAKADVILETVMNNGGIYAYTNMCDENNNPQEVVDNEMIILDTAIEPARGAGKMVQQLTIHKTGGITSTTK